MPSDKSKTHSRKQESRQRKRPDNVSQSTNSSNATGLLVSSPRQTPTRTRNVADIKNRAIRTEELTQRAHRFNYQLAIDLREILQMEFDGLELKSADPRTPVEDLKILLIALSSKITSEIDKQIDVQRKIADAYQAMYHEVTKMAKQVLSEMDSAHPFGGATSEATRLLSDVMLVIRESVEYWMNLPEVSHKKLYEIRRDAPKESMNLDEMYERLENQIKACHNALEHPMSGAISISKEFAKLNIHRLLK